VATIRACSDAADLLTAPLIECFPFRPFDRDPLSLETLVELLHLFVVNHDVFCFVRTQRATAFRRRVWTFPVNDQMHLPMLGIRYLKHTPRLSLSVACQTEFSERACVCPFFARNRLTELL